MSAIRQRALAWGLLAALASSSSCSKDFVVVRLTGVDRDLTVAPLDVTVGVSSANLRETFTYSATFTEPASADANSPVGPSDFVVELGPGAGDGIDVAAFVPGSSRRWGGDARIALPGDGRTVDVPLALGELNIGPARVTEGDTQTSAPFTTGVILAWPDLDGVSTRIERDPDKPLQRSKLVVTEPNASSIRVASRPLVSDATPGSDFAALVWHSENGTLAIRTFTSAVDNAPVTIGQGADIHVASMPAGSPFDVVTISLESGRIWASFHDAAGNDATTHVAPPNRVEVALAPKLNVRSLIGVLPGEAGTFVAAFRGGVDKTVDATLVRVDASGAILAQATVPGDIRSIAEAPSGATLLVASVVPAAADGAFGVGTYDARTLAPLAAPTKLASARDMPTGALARVALADCVVVWPETRRDGTQGVDLRYVYLGTDGVPLTGAGRAPHRANIALDGDAFAPTASCLAPTRAYVSFIARTDAAAFLGQLQLRRLPFSSP